MRVPYRKPGKYADIPLDLNITKAKFDRLSKKLDKLKNEDKPFWMKEVSRLAELGDFSENVEYQLAKRHLRSTNSAILKTEYIVDHAEIIDPLSIDTVQVGHTITIFDGKGEKILTLLGPSETNPAKGIISYKSPIGEAMLGKKVGDVFEVMIGGKKIEFRVVGIS